MRTLSFCAIFLFAAAAQSQLGGGNTSGGTATQHHCAVSADEKAIRHIAEQWKDSYNRGDAATIAALYTEDADYLTQHFATGIVHGRSAIRAYVQLGVDAKYHIDSIEILSTGCAGDLAYTVGQYESNNGGQKALGVNIVVLRRTGGKWLIVAHEAAVPDPATAIQHLNIGAKQ
jgi:uncharacterized protein (TIGR02246 family)